MAKFIFGREEIENAPVDSYVAEDRPGRLVMPTAIPERRLEKMRVVTVGNEKGGVGKTTIAVHAAMGLAARGYRVLLMDGDPQGHATIRCGLKKLPGLYDLLVRDAEWDDVLLRVSPDRWRETGVTTPGELFVLPSNVETRNIASSISEVEIISYRLKELQGKVDVVLIDTSPTPSLLHGAFYTATDAILYPTKLTHNAFDGLVESWKRRIQANEVRANRGLTNITMWGVVPVDHRPNTLEQQENLAKLEDLITADKIWRPIPQRTIWTETESFMQPVWRLDAHSAGAKDAWGLIDRFEKELHNNG